jgi:AraC-like DNA-binding protein
MSRTATASKPDDESEGSADLFGNQLAAGSSTVFSCLAGLAALRSAEGSYQWPEMEARLSQTDIDRYLRNWHDQAFACWLSLAPARQALELGQHLSSNLFHCSPPLSGFRVLIPAGATRPEIDLYNVDLRLCLSLLNSGSATQAAHRHTLTLLRAIKVSGGAISLSLKELGPAEGITPNHLGRIFHEQVGKSFREYLRLVRLGRAAYLLRCSHKPVKSLAAEAGYPDASNFVHDFKDIFGKSPQTYRTCANPSGSIIPSQRSLILTIARADRFHLDCNSDTTHPSGHKASH